MTTPFAADSDAAIARDIAAISQISAVPALLRVICDFTGMGYAAVARVTAGNWTACAVQDNIAFGLGVGAQLPLETTLCNEARLAKKPVAFDHASTDPVYREHHTPRIYGIESYISVPIIRQNGSYFGNLCAVDPKPAKISDARTLAMFELFAQLIAIQLESEDRFVASESALLDARTTSDLREEFIAVLGHDLRNPLAAVHASAELLIRSPQEAVKVGTRLRTTAQRMSRLIDDVMDFARGRLGGGIGVTLKAEPELGEALQDVVEELRQAHPRRLIVAEIAVDRPVVCDRGRVQQLLSNLLGNALTHGAPNLPVVVRAEVDGPCLSISVENGGEALDPASLQKVFAPYWRATASKPGGGLGLGLYICAQIAKAHCGEMTVSSTALGVTRFTGRLPVSPAHGQPADCQPGADQTRYV